MLRSLALAFFLILTALPLGSAAADPYEINAIIPQTGSSAFLGRAFTATLSVIENAVNASGGIRGRPIKFVIADDQSNPQIAVQIVNTLIAAHVPAIIGPSATANCSAAMPLVRDGPLLYCLAAGVSPPPGSYVYSAGVATLSTLQVLAHYFHERGWYKIGSITSNDASGQEAEHSMDRAFAEENGESIIDHEHFGATDISVAAQMSRLAASGAQAIIAWTVGTPFGTLIRGIHDAGITVPIAGSNANLSFAQLQALKPYIPRELYFVGIPSAASVAQLPRGPVRRAQEAYIEDFRAAGIQPEIGEFQIWDEVWLIVDGLRKLGTSATASQLRDFINSQRNWPGVHGPYDFVAVPQRGIGRSSIWIARWDPAKATWENVSRPGGEPLPAAR